MSFDSICKDQPYPFSLPPLEGAISDFLRPSSNRLLISICDISLEEASVLSKGEMRCGLLAKNGAMLFLWQFKDKRGQPVFTLDSPFDAKAINDIQLYDVNTSETRMNIDVHAVDLSSKLVRSLRSITMPPGLTLEFLSAVQDQLATHDDGNMQLKTWMSMGPYELTKQTKMWLMGK